MECLRLLVFDCDGVLFSSKLANIKFYNFLLEKVGRAPMTEEEIEFIHVHSVGECLEYLCRNHPEKLEIIKEVYKKTPYSLFFKYLVMEEGLREFLEWAKPYFYISLCTNRTNSAHPLLKYFDLKKYFDFIMTAERIPKSNPQALGEILHYFKENFKIEPEEALYIGDSQVDELLCKYWNVKFVAFKNPSLSADYHVKSFKELKEIIEKNFHFSRKE